MSKDGLPTLKDGELFGDVLKQPIVTRYHGVDTQTVEGAALVAARAGEINRFVAKARQAYSLSGRTHLALRGQITDGDVRYTNQFGNEIVDVRVDTPKPHPEKVKLTDAWDWLQVDIVIPDAAGFVPMAAAYLTRPLTPPTIDPLATLPLQGIDATGVGEDSGTLPKPVVLFAINDQNYPDLGAEPGSDQVVSLLLDARNFHTYPEVRIDIYGNLPFDVETVDLPPVLTGSEWLGEYRAESGIFWSGGPSQAEWAAIYPEVAGYSFGHTSSSDFAIDWVDNADTVMRTIVGNAGGTYFNRLSHWADGAYDSAGDDYNANFVANSVVETPLPLDSSYRGKVRYQFAYHADYSGTKTWDDGAVGPAIVFATLPSPPGDAINDLPDGDGVTTGWARMGSGDRTYYYYPTYESGGTETVTTPRTRTCTVKSVAFKGRPPWGTAGDTDYRRWELTDRFPTQIGMVTLSNALEIGSVDGAGTGTVAEHFNLTLLGSVRFQPPVGGAEFHLA